MLHATLRKSQGGFRLDASLDAAPGEVTALFGRSGAGKSTMARLIAGIETADGGRITLGEQVLYDSAAGINLPPHRRQIGLVFQDSRLLPHYSVEGNLRFGLNRTKAALRFSEFDQVVALLGLGGLLQRRPHSLSGGERQRVAIGRALLASPRLLVMDEPLAALDGARKAELLPFIARLATEFRLPILYVTHASDEILRLAQRMVLLEQGMVVASGRVEAVMGCPAFARAAGSRSLITILPASLIGHDEQHRTSRLRIQGGEISVPRLDLPIGSALRARIAADQVILALEPIKGLSVRNQMAGKIVALSQEDDRVDVLLDVGCPLHAEITIDACQDLGLATGMTVTALIKGAAIQSFAGGSGPGQ